VIKHVAQKTVTDLYEKEHVPVLTYKRFFSFLRRWILIYTIETAKKYRKSAYRESSPTTRQCYLKAILEKNALTI